MNRVEREKHQLSVNKLILQADTLYRCKLMIRILRIDGQVAVSCILSFPVRVRSTI